MNAVPHQTSRRPTRRGLTLVEVLAVVIILATLAGVLTTSFRGEVGRAKREIAKTGISVVVNALHTYELEIGRLPTTSEGLDLLTKPRPGGGEPYLRRDKLIDPWGRPYAYLSPGPQYAYQVICFGADGRSGGAPGSDAADVTSDDLRSE